MSGSVSFLRDFSPPDITGKAVVKSAARKAFEAGVEEGRAQAQTDLDRQQLIILDALQQRLSQIEVLREELNAAAHADAAMAVAAVVRALCPMLATRGLADSVQALVRNAFTDSPRALVIDVASDSFDALTEALGEMGESRVSLRLNAALPPASAEISNEDGFMRVDVDSMVNRIMDDVALMEQPIHHSTKEGQS